jgi:type II secretory pathway component PulL
MGDKVFFDLRENGVSVYSLKRNGKSWVPSEGVSYPVGEDYSFSVGKELAHGAESYLSLPLSLLSFRVIELPFSDMGKIRELLPFEIEGLIIGDPKDFIFDACILGKKDDKFEVLVAYLSKDVLRKVLNGVKAAGFDPRAVTSLELACILGSSTSGDGVMAGILNPAPVSETDRVRSLSQEMENTTLDLRRDEFVFTADRERTRSSLKITLVLGAAVLIIFLVHAATTIISLKSENQSLRDSIRRTYLGMFPGEKRVADEIYQTKAHLKELSDKKDTYVGVSPLLLLLDLSRVARPGVSFTEVTADRELIVLKGECASLSDAQRIKDDLGTFLTGVNISDTKPSAQNRTTFTITAKGRKT